MKEGQPMTEELNLLREALRRVKYEAASLADAQVIALEALTTSQPAQAGEVDEREAFEAWARPHGYDLRRNAVLGHYSSIDTLRAWNGWQARASLPAQPAAQATPEPAGVQTTPTFAQLKQILDGLARCHARDSRAEFLRTWIRDWTQHKLNQATTATPPQQAAGEPVYQYQRGDGSWIDQTRASYDYNVKHGNAVRVLYTHPAPGVPEGFDALMQSLRPLLITMEINDTDTLSAKRHDEKVIWTASGSWTGVAKLTLGDLRRICAAAAQAKGGE